MIINNKQFNFSPKILFRDKGQTLIEAIVTIGVALVIIASIVSLVNASNRRSTNARQATQASKLAQEGLEIVRNIRDVNAAGVVRVGDNASGACTAADPCSWSELYDADQTDPVEACLSFASPSWYLRPTGNPSCETTAADLFGVFSREVIIEDDLIDTNGDGTPDAICSGLQLPLGQIKRVTVYVTWNSPVGAQERNAVTCLTKR